ncbi:MAG: energy transducer TonB [Gammaproteobacteria bacterium]|nr:MAG: energy transducer TonB [Gammaproteobacteria bacterium]
MDVTALTTRDDFLLELGQALSRQAAVRPVESLEEALRSMAGANRGQVLAIDAREVPDVRAAVDAAHAQVPRAVVLVFAEGPAEKELGAALKDSRIFAVLPTSIEPRRTQEAFTDAMAQALQAPPTPRASPAAAWERTIRAFRRRPPEPDEELAGSRPRLVLIGAALVAALVAAGLWFFMSGRGGPVTLATHPAAAAAAPAAAAVPADNALAPAAPAASLLLEGKVDELLEKARLAMHERRYTEPAADNALLYYRSAAAADPVNGEAQDGLQRVAGVLAARFEEALSGGRVDEAVLTLANLKAASASDPRVAGFEERLFSAEVSKALADGNVERAAALVHQAQQAGSLPADQLARWRTDIARRQEDGKLQHLATLVEDRIRDGKLTEGDDSAKSHLQQLQSGAPANAATQRAVHALTAAYLKKAREAALAKNSADEERWLSDGRLTDPAQDSATWYLGQLQSSDPGNAAVADASRELAGKLLERARAAVLAGKSGDADLAQAKRFGADPKEALAVQQLTPAKSKGPDTAALASRLTRLRGASPDYPAPALTQHLAGSVVLEFTVDTSGETRDIHVVEATPPGVFDQAAINAVKRWRYAPPLVNGAAAEVPVRTRMRFELPK